jgi:hypothetical protein
MHDREGIWRSSWWAMVLKKKELDMWAQYIHMLIAKWEASLIEEDLTWLDALKESKIKYSGHQSCGTWKD